MPHPRPLPKGRSRSRPRFCTWGRQPPRPKSGRLAHLAQVEDHKSDVGDRCSGGLSWRVHGSGQPTRWWEAASAGLLSGYAGGPSAAGGCAAVWRPMHVRRAAGDSGCTIGGAVPEFGRSAVHISESIVGPPGLTPPFGCLLWAARSAVACPVCLWGGAAWHGGCALLPRWWSAPAAPSCRGSRFDSSCRVPAAGGAPPAAGIRPRAEDARRQP